MAPKHGGSKLLRGYTKVGSRYRTPNGVEISGYEYRSRVARKNGWKNYSEARKWSESQSFKSWRFQTRREKANYDRKGKWIGPDLSVSGRFSRDSFITSERERKGEPLIISTPGSREPEAGRQLRADETELGRLLIAMGRIPADAMVPFT